MLVLTLRSGRDGRYLARVLDQGGRPFVLDHGDPRVIEDLVQRITRGFTVIRQGRLLHVHPGDPDLLAQLAGFYIEEGALVFLEEPNWPGRTGDKRAPRVVASVDDPAPAPAPLDDLPELDEPTETIAMSDLPSVDEALTTIVPDAEPAPIRSLPVAPSPPPPAPDEVDEARGLLPGAPGWPPRGG